MDGNWSLKELYSGFDDKNFIKDINSLKKDISELNNFAEKNFTDIDNAKEKIEYYIDFQNKFGEKASKLYEFCELSLSTDASNETALKNIDKIQNILTDASLAETKFKIWLRKIENIKEITKKSKLIKEHLFFIKQILKDKSELSEKEELIIKKMETTGSSSWTKLQEGEVSELLIPLTIKKKKKDYPLSELRNLAYSADKTVRKAAYEAELNAYPQIDNAVAYALNGIKGEVLTVSKLRGYKSPLEMTLLQSRIDNKILESMLTAIREYLPVFRKYFQRKSEMLGHKEGLPFYDLFAPVGNCDMKFTPEEARDFIVKNFTTFSKDLGDYAKFAFDNAWIDLFPKRGKRGGAFCSNLHSIKQSRILTNFTGTFNDVVTLAHELGHGYHGKCLDYETYLNSDYPMPIAETASTFCETIIKNAALKDATDEQALMIIESDIADNAQVVVDILCRFIFEDTVINLRKDGPLSSKELCEIMLNSQKETYGDGLDNKYLHKYMWVCKPHYYEAAYNYYNFPYAFGLLFAKGLYAKYLEDGENFVPLYDKILAATGKNNIADVAKLAGINIRDKKFFETSLELIKKDIEKFLEI